MLAFVAGSAALFLGKSAFLGVRILALLAMAKIGDARIFACISFAIALSEMGRLLTDCGTDTWCVRAIAQSGSAHEKSRIICSALIIKAACSLAAWLAIVAICTLKFGSAGVFSGLLAGLLMLAGHVAGITIAFLQAQNRLGELRILAIPCMVTAICVVATLLATGNSLAALAVLCGGEVTAAIALLSVLRRHGMLSHALPARADVKHMLSACAPLALLNLLMGVYSRLDTLVLVQVSLSSLAVYTVANRLFQPFQVAFTTLGATVYGRTSAAAGTDQRFIRELLTRQVPFIAVTAAIGGLLLWGMGSLIIETLLQSYLEAIEPLRIFAVTLIVVAVNSAASGMLFAYGRFAAVVRIAALETVCAFVAMLVLAPRWGATGAAAALLVAALINATIQYPYALVVWRRQLAAAGKEQ